MSKSVLLSAKSFIPTISMAKLHEKQPSYSANVLATFVFFNIKFSGKDKGKWLSYTVPYIPPSYQKYKSFSGEGIRIRSRKISCAFFAV